jgi:C1A family cysteine protease
MFGYIQDAPDSTDPDAEEVLSKNPPAERVSYTHLLDKVLDQGQTGTCTVHAIQTASYLATRISNPAIIPPRLNMLIPYWDGRDDNRIDNGAQPRKIMRAMWDEGYCLESAWPFSPTRLFTPPPARLRFQSYPQVGKLRFLRISDDGGAKRVDQIKRGLTGGVPSVLSLALDEGFRQYRDGIWTLRGPEIGQHYLCVVGYDADSAHIVNSWGEDFGEADPEQRFQGGFVRVSWDVIEDPDLCRDNYLIHHAEMS